MSRPKHGNDVKWISKTFNKIELLDMCKEEDTEIVFNYILEEILSASVGAVTLSMSKILGKVYNENKKRELKNSIIDHLMFSDSATISFKYVAYRKGNAGLFWLPTNEFKIS